MSDKPQIIVQGDYYNQSGNFGAGNVSNSEIKDQAKLGGIINESGEINNNASSKKAENTKFLELTISGNFESTDLADILRIQSELISKLKNTQKTSINIVDAEPGSIKLTFEGSEDELKQIKAFIESGELTELSGRIIENARLIDSESEEEALKNKVSSRNQLVHEIRSQNITGRKLGKSDLKFCDLQNVFLEEANLTEANFSGSNLRNANLKRADLSNANLSGADLSNADLREIKINDKTKIDSQWRKVLDEVNKDNDLRDANQEITKLNKIRLNNFSFKPLSNSWIAIHPQPKGVIQFIGEALFGSVPTIFYHYFLKKIYEAGYTIIAFPYKSTFNHWSVSLQIQREQNILRREIIKKAIDLKYNHEIYLDNDNYQWIGYGLGCKYILLLELLSVFELSNNSINWSENWQQIKSNLSDHDREQLLQVSRQLDKLKDKMKNVFDECQEINEEIKKLVGRNINLNGLSFRNEASLLIAPDIGDTDSAIPIKSVAKLVDILGLGTQPTEKQIRLLIKNSSLFSLTTILAFEKDRIAGNINDSADDSSVGWLVSNLKYRLKGVEQVDNAYHLELHGYQVDKYVVDFFSSIIFLVTKIASLSLIWTPKRFFNEIRKPIFKSLTERSKLHDKVLLCLS